MTPRAPLAGVLLYSLKPYGTMLHMKLDLQTHSWHSDGEWSPARLVEHAIDHRLEAFAITDHNYLAPETLGAYAAGRKAGIRCVVGAEISCKDARRGASLHLLAYGIPEERVAEFNAGLVSVREGYDRRAKLIIAKLNGRFPGLELDFDAMKGGRGEAIVDRNHLAEALRRFTGEEAMTMREALRHAFIEDEDDDWMPDIREMIRFVHGFGGIAMLAHPGSVRGRMEDVDAAFQEYVDAGLDGFEVWDPHRENEWIFKMQRLCADKGLLMSAGSDWHGPEFTSETEFGMMMPADEATRLLTKLGA